MNADALKLSCEIGNAVFRARPFLLYFKPTARCDLRCDICDRWKQPRSIDDELSLTQIEAMLAKFRRAGFAILTLWGGEPTLRPDLSQILSAARSLGFRTSMCTNGNRLAKRAEQLVPQLDSLLCSIDGYGEVHDQIRGVAGVFDRAVASVAAAARYGNCDVKIWSALQRGNLDQIEKLAWLARDLGVGIEFFPVSAVPGHNDKLIPSRDELAKAFTEIAELKQIGLPIRNPDRVLRIMRDGESFACNFGQIAVYLDQRGQVYSCEDAAGRPLHCWGRYDSFDPQAVFRTPEFRRVVSELRRCGGCRLPCVVELSGNIYGALAGMLLRRMERD